MVGAHGARWTPSEIRDSRPDIIEAARWLVYAERLWPGASVEADLDAPEKPTEAWVRAQRRRGRTALRAIRRALLPPDEEPT